MPRKIKMPTRVVVSCRLCLYLRKTLCVCGVLVWAVAERFCTLPPPLGVEPNFLLFVVVDGWLFRVALFPSQPQLLGVGDLVEISEGPFALKKGEVSKIKDGEKTWRGIFPRVVLSFLL